MTTKRTEVLLGDGNYYHWEFNMRMALARKGLLGHIMGAKGESEITETWLVNDAKALGIIAQGVEIQHQTKIRSATRALEAWGTLRDFYHRSTLHNRVTMTRRLHEFKMESGTRMVEHLDAFDELVVGLQMTGEPVDESRQLVVLLSSLPAEYEIISSIVENAKDITLIEVKEKLLKESDRLQKKEASEKAFRATYNDGRIKGRRGSGRKDYAPRKGGGFRGKCFNCNQTGHMKRDCPAAENRSRNRYSGNDAVFAVGDEKSVSWLIDSGATSHMTPHRSDLIDFKQLKDDIKVTIADGRKLRVEGAGTVKLIGLDGRRISMMEVLLIPGLDRRLLSVGKLAERGLSVEFQRASCIIWDKNEALATGTRNGKAYTLDCQQEEARLVQYSGVDSQWELWHARMGHPSEDVLVKTMRSTEGIPALKQGIKTLCGGCMKGKQTIEAFPGRSMTKTSRVLELVHTDVMGPMKTLSKGGAKYILTFVDDYSRYVVAYFLAKKSEVADKIKMFKALHENQWGARIKCLRSDNGTEFVNKTVTNLCQRNGIIHQRTVPYSPQQNGIAERMNRTIMEKARSMLHYKCVPICWWAEAVSTAVYLINRSPNTVHPNNTPYELGFKMKPRMDHLRVFGSHGYAHVDQVKRTKLEAKSFKCMFLGYAEDTKGYRVYDLEKDKISVSRSVKLDEREVGGIYETHTPKQIKVIHVTKDNDESAVSGPTEHQQDQDELMEGEGEDEIPDAPMNEEESDTNESRIEMLRLPTSVHSELTEYRPPTLDAQEDRLVFRPQVERSRRTNEPMLLLENGSDADESLGGSEGPPSSKRARIDEDGLIAEAILAYAVSVGEESDLPTTYAQAMSSDEAEQWRQAMDAELQSHHKNKTWTLVPRESIGRTIGCRWVFAKKRDQNGCVVRYKARLVAKGFKQKYGVDFFETYSPVANMNSIRVVLAVCAVLSYKMEQLDVDTAFLNSVLSDRVHMEVPIGVKGAQGFACQLNKAIYGLKQAASAWNKTIDHVFKKNDFKSCGADQCVYVKKVEEGFVYVCLYVDDMIIAAKTSDEILEVKGMLKSVFKMKDLGMAKFILGMEIDHDMTASTLMIKQTRYISDVAERFGQKNAKNVDNPCTSGLKLSTSQSPSTEAERSEMRSRPYRSLIGCLLYVTTCTRPDVAYIVTQLSRFLEKPGLPHWNAAIRVLRYLNSTRHHGIVYQRGTGKVIVEAFSDADWGSNTDDRRSVSGVLINIGKAPVVFKSKYQRTVALSSAEAEYMALSLCTQEVLWARAMLKDMGQEQVGGTQIWEDNQGAIALANNAGYHARTKHVDIRHHFIRENVQHGLLKIGYIDTKSQLADMLTKALGTKMLKYLREASGIKTKSATKDTQH